VSITRKRLATSLAVVVCAALGASMPTTAAEAAGPIAHISSHARKTTHATRVHAACIARVERSRVKARKASRACRAYTSKVKLVHRTAPHRVPAKRTAKSTQAASVPAPAGNTAQETAAAIAQVLATTCQNTELTPDAEDIPLVRAAVLCLINRIRAENARAPLTVNPELEQAAEGHCAELIADDYFAHVSPSGETPVDRIRTTGYIPGPSVGYAIGENLAWGTYSLSTPQAIVSAWVASPGHLANILEGQYTETGIGVTPAVPSSLAEGAPGATYGQEFGVIIH
jgi:uncharacterized protein YkwD